MLVGQAQSGNGVGLVVGGFLDALAKFFVVRFVIVGALGAAAGNLGGQGKLRGNLHLDGSVSGGDRFQHFGFADLGHFAFHHHNALVRGTDHHFDVGQGQLSG